MRVAVKKLAKAQSRRQLKLLFFALAFFTIVCSGYSNQLPIPNSQLEWPMASGPTGNWTADTDISIPRSWSVSADENIRWKTELPEGGQSGIAVWGDRLFLTINKPLPVGTPVEEMKGSDIVGYCLDSNSGKVLWTVDIPSPKEMPHSGLFSDNTSATPITDGKHVWFFNHGGTILCCDMEGMELWRRSFESRTRHNAKQCEPILVDGQLLFVMTRDSDDPLRRPMRAKPGERETPAEWWPWTFVRALDAETGKPLWTESSGTSVHNTPRIGYLHGLPVVFHARGGGHKPPEVPYGFSMSWAGGEQAGEVLWSYESSKVVAYTVSHFDEQFAYGFDGGILVQLDARTGNLKTRFPIYDRADIRLWDAEKGRYEIHRDAPFSVVVDKFKKDPTNQTTILVGDYFLYLSHSGHCIARVNTRTGKTEYLQVPRQVVRDRNGSEEVLWDSHIPSFATNSRGMPTASDRRSERDGWGHVTAGSPIAINQYVFFSTMIGMTYVVDSSVDTFDESALVAINDLGPTGETWSLSSLSYSRGKLYHRGLKHVACIETQSP